MDIARPPGSGKLVELDLVNSRAKVLTPGGELSLTVQELFPQTGPFVVHRRTPEHAGRREKGKPQMDRPIHRRSPDSAAAKANREAVLKTAPGEELYVVPFHRRATLIRFNHEKDQAVVEWGAFEMQVPISDLEPARPKH
jgi:hypothetical protein